MHQGRLPATALRIAVIDGDPTASEIVATYLGKGGYAAGQRYQVATASNGRQGLAAIAAKRPDLIILGLMSPEIAGFALLDQLECDRRTSSVPVC